MTIISLQAVVRYAFSRVGYVHVIFLLIHDHRVVSRRLSHRGKGELNPEVLKPSTILVIGLEGDEVPRRHHVLPSPPFALLIVDRSTVATLVVCKSTF